MPSYSKLKAQVSLDGLIALIVFILIIGHVASIYTSLLKSQQETGFKALARYHTLALADYATAIKIMREPGVTSSLDLNLPKGQVPVYGLIFSARTGLIPDPLEEGADLYFKDPYFLPEECEFSINPSQGTASLHVTHYGPGRTLLEPVDFTDDSVVLCTGAECPGVGPVKVSCGETLDCNWKENRLECGAA